jgi:bla regulator protein blaR1
VRWRNVSRYIRTAVPLYKGREIEALRRMERIAGIGRRIDLRLTSASLEPSIFGILRPVLLWPQGISEHLDDRHLEAIAAHEVWHVRRRDNLAGAIHMLVAAIFWFHPLVWWLGARLLEERERACDEQVLALGSVPQIYAESILKTCEFCTASTLACVSGVTGAQLKQRIVQIMTLQTARQLDFSRKLLLTAAGFTAISVPLLLGITKMEPVGIELKSMDLGREARRPATLERAPAEFHKSVVSVGPKLSSANPKECTKSSRVSNSPSFKK